VNEPRPQVQLHVPWSTLLKLAVFGAAIALVIVALDVLLSIFVAIVLALGLDPVVGALVARGWKRGRAALFVFASLFVAVALIVLITVGPLWDQVRDFVNEVPQYWEEISNSDAFQTFISSGSQEDVKQALEDLASGLPEAASTLLGVAGGIFGSVLSLVTLTFLALFMLIERHTITEWLFDLAPPAIQRRWHPVLEDSISAVSSSLIGNLAISLVAATVAGVSAWIFGLPFPIVLAVMTGFLDLIPQVGATVAGVILVLVALTVSTPAAIAMAVIQIVYQQVENYIVYPIVYRRAVELSPFTTIVAVLVASSILGVLGAILAVPFAAIAKIVIREASRPRRERMAGLRNATS
jgi:predicted PurR-regulated permease PerM